MIVPESHNGAFAIVLSDLLQGQIQAFLRAAYAGSVELTSGFLAGMIP
jgi:hypothetical protein